MCNCKNCGAPLSKNRCLYCGTEYPSRTSSRGGTTIDAAMSAAESIRGSMIRVGVIEDIHDAQIKEAQIKEAHISNAKIRNILDDVRYTIGK